MFEVPKSIRNWAAVTMVGATLTIGALSLIQAVPTIGKPFAGFFVGPNLLVAISQRQAWPGIQGGLRSLDRIVAIDGNPVSTIDEFTDRISGRQPGESLIYRFDRKGVVKDVAIPVSRYSLNDFLLVFLVPFLMGLLFVSFGSILYFAQPDSRGSIVYLGLCCAVGLFCMVLFESYTTYAFFRITLIYPLIGALATHLLSLFRQNLSGRPLARFSVYSLYFLALALIFGREIVLYDPSYSELFSRLSSTYILIALVVDLLLLVSAYQQSRAQATRDRIKLILIGTFIAGSFFAAWSLNFLLKTKSFYLDEQILIACVFPIFMGYAILRKNIFNLDHVIRLSLGYGVVAALVLVFYVVVVGAIRQAMPPEAYNRPSGWLLIVLAGLGAVAFNYLRKPVNRWIHRSLFRGHYDLAEALAELDQSLARGIPAKELANRVEKRLSEILGVEKAAAVLLPYHPSDEITVHSSRWADPSPIAKWISLFEAEGVLEHLRGKASPIEVIDLSEDRPESFLQSIATLRAQQVEALVPFVASGKLYGFLLLGKKLSQARFDSTDFSLLEPLVFRTGMSLENAHLTTEAERQARLAALGQVASIMVHDIKNPLGTIKISAGSIKRRFREGDHSYELAEIIEDEVDRMNQTVQEILHFVKPRGLSLSLQSMNQLVQNVVTRLTPDLDRGKIQLALELTTDDTTLSCDEGRVERALTNLLLNSREATPAGGTVTVRTMVEGRTNGHAKVMVVIEDTGVGMEPDVRERVFQPFFTTKPNGTGLGLAMVRQVIQEHEGSIDVESWPGKGTRLTLHFPIQVVK